MMAAAPAPSIHSTAGAVAVRNEKGEITLEKVKVFHHRAGKKPQYAGSSDSSESDEENFIARTESRDTAAPLSSLEGATDRRLQRLQHTTVTTTTGRHRAAVEATILEEEGSADETRLRRSSRRHAPSDDEDASASEENEAAGKRGTSLRADAEADLDDEDDEAAIALRRRHALERAKLRAAAEEEEMEIQAEAGIDEDEMEEGSEYESYTDESEEEETPLHKPVFVPKGNRVALQKQKEELEEIARKQVEEVRKAEARVQSSRILVSELVQQDINAELAAPIQVEDDDGDEEEEFELWKIRELNRIKRNRAERDAADQQRAEVDRLREMTTEERNLALRSRERIITNKQSEGKMGFLQKYYHRGAFFLDEENELLTRDVNQPTLEDHFDKRVMPKVMQVKRFGRHGQTKYTHLRDQDTTDADSAWAQKTLVNAKVDAKRGGVADVFDRPSSKRKR